MNGMSELDQLIEYSKNNEAIARKLFEIETEILACQSSSELLQQLLNSIKEKFELTNIHLLLAEPTPISYLLSGNMQKPWHHQLTRQIPKDILAKFHPTGKPFLSNQLTNIINILPKGLIVNEQSIALIPLTLENKLFGSLLFTDHNKERFDSNLGTFHLEQLAVKVSLCLSNVLIREQLEHMAHYDRLTGVANRRLMEESIEKELIRQRRYGVPFSILFIDCDKFKQINDNYGHDCGDKVLTYVATQLTELIRENDTCFRYAGDEFVITLASQTYTEAVMAAKRLSDFFINNPMQYEGQKLPLTISCGVAASKADENIDDLLKRADKHLYQQKNSATIAYSK